MLLAGAWSWAIDSAFRPGRHPAYGFEPTRDAAMQALARSWFVNEGHYHECGEARGKRPRPWGRPNAHVQSSSEQIVPVCPETKILSSQLQ